MLFTLSMSKMDQQVCEVGKRQGEGWAREKVEQVSFPTLGGWVHTVSQK